MSRLSQRQSTRRVARHVRSPPNPPRRRQRKSRRRANGPQGPRGDQRRPHAQRHHAGAHPLDLRPAARNPSAHLRRDGTDHLRLSGDRVAPAAVRRHLHRSPAQALFAGHRHDGSRSSGCCSSRSRTTCGRSWPRPRSSAPARASSIPRPRAWPTWRPAVGTASPSRCSRSAATSARRSARCWSPRIVYPYGQGNIAWFALVAARRHRRAHPRRRLVQLEAWRPARRPHGARSRVTRPLPPRQVAVAIGVLIGLVISKYIYLVSFTSYYAVYLIEKFGVSKSTRRSTRSSSCSPSPRARSPAARWAIASAERA